MRYLGRFNGIALVAALLGILTTAPSLLAEPILGGEEDLPGSLSDLAHEAGSRAAILGQCGIGGRPVMLAFEQRLQDAGLSAAAKGQLLQSFQDARASAVAALAATGSSQCSGAYGLLRDTLRDLHRPLT